jgi:hypothetical protein
LSQHKKENMGFKNGNCTPKAQETIEKNHVSWNTSELKTSVPFRA